MLRKLMQFIFVPSLPPVIILTASLICTAVHSRDLVDFGLTLETPYNAIIWHFTHRSYFHGLANFLLLIALIGSGISVSIFELLMLSGFVLVLGIADPAPFYGASGIIFLFVGKLTRKHFVLSSYNLCYLPIRIPYLTMTLLIVYQITMMEGASLSIELVHLYAFLFGVSEISIEKAGYFSELEKTSVEAQHPSLNYLK